MAESTRSKSNLDRIEEVIAKLMTNQQHYSTHQHQVTTKLDELLQWISIVEHNQNS